jgi:hypothetical protein
MTVDIEKIRAGLVIRNKKCAVQQTLSACAVCVTATACLAILILHLIGKF